VVALALLRGVAPAQDISGTIGGTVVDDASQLVPGANVTLINERTRASRSVASDERGEFRFLGVDPGPYTVRVELSGFQPLERRNNVLSASERLSLGALKLRVGGLSEAVTVEASGAKVNPEESQHTGLLTATQIEQIQTKGRDVANLLRLLPGVRYGDDVEALGESFGTELPNIGGQRKHWNHVSIDGVMGNEIGGSNRVAQQINLDAIEEVKVLLNTYRAEYGRGGGAYIQIVSRSGGARYRGSGYYYGRHEKLNANGYFDNLRGIPRGHYRYNTFGFNLGGPVKLPGLWEQGREKRLFFHYSVEAPLTERPGTQREFRMPTALERRGDFSLSGITLYDPLNGEPFPGNLIPQERIHPSGQALLNLYPLPNNRVLNNRRNHVHRHATDNPRLNNVLRLDWKRSSRDSFFLSLKDWYSDQRGVDITVGPSRWGLFDAHYKVTDRTLAAGHTHFFGGGLINEVSAGIRRQTEEFYPVREADRAKLRRASVGFTVGQFHPDLNPQGIIPKVLFGSGVGSGEQPADRQLAEHLLRHLRHAALAARREPARQRARARARRQDRERLLLVARRPARAGLGHGRGRDLQRVGEPAPVAGRLPEPRAGRGQAARPAPRERGSQERARAARHLPEADHAIRRDHAAGELGHAELQRAAGPGEPPLHQGPPVQRRLHVFEGARHR
jgi:hypothetical protein